MRIDKTLNLRWNDLVRVVALRLRQPKVGCKILYPHHFD